MVKNHVETDWQLRLIQEYCWGNPDPHVNFSVCPLETEVTAVSIQGDDVIFRYNAVPAVGTSGLILRAGATYFFYCDGATLRNYYFKTLGASVIDVAHFKFA